jgi:predicted nucleotidyltransferase
MPIFTQELSIVDPIRPTLDPEIINNGKVIPLVRTKIIKSVTQISNDLNLKIEDIWLLGSSLTKQWTPNSDFDVTVFCDKEKKELHEINKICAKKYNEKIYFGKHPVNFYFTKKPFFKFKADAIYDLQNNKWIKKAKPVSEEDMEELIDQCSSAKEFNEILSEYTKLKNLLEEKLDYKKIIEQAFKVNHLFENLKEVRRNDFEKRKNDDLPSANWRCSNIIFKLLENYGLEKLSNQLAVFFAKH